MSSTESSQVNGRNRRSSKGLVRAIEYSRRTVTGTDTVPGYARYVGRVGPLAVALGIGSGIHCVMLGVQWGDTGCQGSASASARQG